MIPTIFMENQEILARASELEQQSQELENQLDFVRNQIKEYDSFSEDLILLMNSDEKEILAPMGKGVYIKSSILDKNFFVEVGSGIVVRKTLKDTLNIIKSQISKFNEIEEHLSVQVKTTHQNLINLINEAQEKSKKPNN